VHGRRLSEREDQAGGRAGDDEGDGIRGARGLGGLRVPQREVREAVRRGRRAAGWVSKQLGSGTGVAKSAENWRPRPAPPEECVRRSYLNTRT
jgi:hypothetical protein